MEVDPQREISDRARRGLAVLAALAPGEWMLARELADRIEAISPLEHLGADRESRRRRVREVIAELRRAGVPVVTDTRHGCRLASDEADAEAHYERIAKLARTHFVLGRYVREAASVEPTGSQKELF